MIALIACIVSTGVFAQEKMDKMATKKDVVMMKDGKMMMIKDGKTMAMDKDVMLKNGTTVMVDGSIKMIILTTTGIFCSFLPEDVILFWSQLCFPLLLC